MVNNVFVYPPFNLLMPLLGLAQLVETSLLETVDRSWGQWTTLCHITMAWTSHQHITMAKDKKVTYIAPYTSVRNLSTTTSVEIFKANSEYKQVNQLCLHVATKANLTHTGQLQSFHHHPLYLCLHFASQETQQCLSSHT